VSGVPEETTNDTTNVTTVDVYERRLPPIDKVGTAIIAVVVSSGVYLAAHLPRKAPLGPAFALLGLAAAMLLWNIVTLSRVRDFAWDSFFLVARWALLAYLVIGGMLEFIFVFDHTRGGVLVVLTLTLAIFAVNIPMVLAYSVARYQPPNPKR
jgi:hypothetical protein